VSKVVPRVSLIKVMLAPGILPPCVSFTVPAAVPVAWAAAKDARPIAAAVMIATTRPLDQLLIMMPPEKDRCAATIQYPTCSGRKCKI